MPIQHQAAAFHSPLAARLMACPLGCWHAVVTLEMALEKSILDRHDMHCFFCEVTEKVDEYLWLWNYFASRKLGHPRNKPSLTLTGSTSCSFHSGPLATNREASVS